MVGLGLLHGAVPDHPDFVVYFRNNLVYQYTEVERTRRAEETGVARPRAVLIAKIAEFSFVEFTDKISALIFALIMIGVLVYLIMSRFVVGPLKGLKTAERVILIVSVIGIVLVVVYAAVELLFHIVF